MNPILKLAMLPLILFPFGVDMAARSIVQRRGDGMTWHDANFVIHHAGIEIDVWYHGDNVRDRETSSFYPGFWQFRLWWAL